MTTATATTRTAEEWVAGFAAGWAEPTDAESFCDHFDAFLANDVRLIQPQLPTVVGKAQFRTAFAEPLFGLLKDVRGTVESWASDGDLMFIELTIRGRVGWRRVTLRTVDRITLRDGLAVERIANLDPTPLVGAVALNPQLWPRFARLQIAARAGAR